MHLQIGKIVGTTSQEIEKNKFNIFVPISLGNKWFTKEHIEEYVTWALRYSKNDVIILIADKLHQINVEVKDHYAPTNAQRKVERTASAIEFEVNEIISKFDKKEQRRLRVLSFGDIDQESKYLSIKNEVYIEFERNKEFRERILNIVKETTRKIGGRKFNDEEILKLSQYVLNELPCLLYGIEYSNDLYNLHPYPVFTNISELVYQIQKGKFEEFYNRIGRPQSVIVELKIAY